MPHLSPMLWFLTFPLFWFLFFLMLSSLWWYQLPMVSISSSFSKQVVCPRWVWE